MLPDGTRIIGMIAHVFPGLILCYTDPAQHLIRAGYDLDYLDRDLSDLSVRSRS